MKTLLAPATMALALILPATAGAATITEVTQDSFRVGGLDCGTQYRITLEENGAESTAQTVTTQSCPSGPPTASFTVSPSSPRIGQPVTFDWTGACDADPCTFVWEDEGPDGPGGTDWPLGTGDPYSRTFSGTGTKYVHLVVTDDQGRTAESRQNVLLGAALPTPTPTPTPTSTPEPTPEPTVTPEPTLTPTPTPDPEPGGLPPLGQPSCVPFAVNVTTASAAASNLASGNDVCVTANIGGLSLVSGTAYTSPGVEFLGTSGVGRIAGLSLNGVVGMNVRVRASNVALYGSDFVTLEQSRLGGDGPASRYGGGDVLNLRDTLDGCDDCVIRDNDIGWTFQSETTGNSGYCVRTFGNNDRMLMARNKIHDCEADGIQGIRGDDVVIDRNEIGPVGDNPQCPYGSLCEHSDGIQEHGRDGDVKITNNWIHHEGYFTNSSGVLVASRAASGTTYIHGGDTSPILYQNNLVENSRGRVEICGLGTGGYGTGNTTVRGNTFRDLSRVFAGVQGFRWYCTSGANNLIADNVMVDQSGGFHDSGLARTLSNNFAGFLGDVTFNADGNCTSLNCVGRGFRKPNGVHW